nr:transposase [Wielerella bovis]
MDYLTALFCQIDDFCKEFEPKFNSKLIKNNKIRNRPSCISTAEIMTVLIAFHQYRMRDFKTYYQWQVQSIWQRDFPNMPSYNCFLELATRALPAMLVFLTTQMGKCTGIGVVDSTTLSVCHNRRIHSHKVFNHLGELVNFCLTAGNVDDLKV